jgi:hypothetical protein
MQRLCQPEGEGRKNFCRPEGEGIKITYNVKCILSISCIQVDEKAY